MWINTIEMDVFRLVVLDLFLFTVLLSLVVTFRGILTYELAIIWHELNIMSILDRIAQYWLNWWEPVSYTHLDVYKRQTQNSARESLQYSFADIKKRRHISEEAYCTHILLGPHTALGDSLFKQEMVNEV